MLWERLWCGCIMCMQPVGHRRPQPLVRGAPVDRPMWPPDMRMVVWARVPVSASSASDEAGGVM